MFCPLLASVLPAATTRDFTDASTWMSIGMQTATTALVAIVAMALHRVITKRFLHYWAISWVALAIGLVALDLAFQFPNYSRILYPCYWIAGDLFGFLLFAGCRDYIHGEPITRKDGWLFGVPAVAGLVLPSFYPHINQLFPIHALILGGFCMMALIQLFQFRSREQQTLIGVRLLRVGLAGMVILFWHYALVMGSTIFGADPNRQLTYLKYSCLYDAYVELVLAFAQVLLATDSVRRQLADANRQLGTATDQLAMAARTDALTGLLNRRAYDAMLSDHSARPVRGCLGVIDVNDLKLLNDRYGHSVGDTVLRVVSRALQGRTRIGDPVFRLGGDEFLIVLPGMSADELTRRMIDVDESLVKSRLPGINEAVVLSIAWGIADFDADTFAAAVEMADAAMYACKQRRKNDTP